jgi:predicted nucleotidyltransferase
MLSKEIIIETLSIQLPKLRSEFKVTKIGLFGSYSKNQANEQSDIDLIIEFSEPIGLKFINLCDYLENLFNKKVDILTPEGLKSIRIKSIVENILRTIEYVQAA